MQNTLYFLSTAAVLGTVAGISPGPLLTLVVSETLKYGKKEGMKLALVPLITDVPIVSISFFVLSRFKDHRIIMGGLSFLGAAFLIYLAWGSIFIKNENNRTMAKTQSLKKGIITNFLSPHPYMFWIFVGGKYLTDASRINLITAILFLVLFYCCLCGSKMIIALLTQQFRGILNTKSYQFTIRILGILLLVLAVQLIIESVNYIF